MEATGWFRQAASHLKAKEREVIDYYAVDLVDLAVYVVNGWLILQDARLLERKLALARVYLAEHLPRVQAAYAAIEAADKTPLEVKAEILTGIV